MAESRSPTDQPEHVVDPHAQLKDEASDGTKGDRKDMEVGKGLQNEATEANGAAQEDNQDVENTSEQDNGPQPSKLKVLWSKLGLDPPTLILMLKGSLPPIISIAFYQAPAVAATYGALGYLVPIISVLSMAILPRAKYIQTLILNILGVCLASSVALLGLWSAIQARIHTTPEGAKVSYNSSQSAICAIWLFVNIWAVNMLRAKYPVVQFPALVYSIFTNVAFSFGPVFQTMPQVEGFVKQLLEGFLTAFAIATGVSLLVVPISSRTVVFKEMTSYIDAIRMTIKAQTAYLRSLERSDMFSQTRKEAMSSNESNGDTSIKDEKATVKNQPEAEALKASVDSLTALHGKLHGDLPFGKREVAYGKLLPEDLDEINKLFLAILIPLIGMSTITDIFERIAERRGWLRPAGRSEFDDAEAWEHDPGEEAKAREKGIWNEVMKQLHFSFEVVSKSADEGLEHAGLLLELIKRPNKKNAVEPDVDIEEKGDIMKPGDKGFAEYLEKKLADFYAQRGQTMKTWAKGRGLSPEQFDEAKYPGIDHLNATPDENHHRRDQQQLYLILYMEFLLYSTGIAVLRFIRFAEGKVEDGTMKKNRFIHPGLRRMRKWVLSLGTEDSTVDSNTPDSLEGASSTVYLGSGFNKKKDPEHLPATNAWEKFGNGIRQISHFLGSVESGFGARVALATMSIAIVAYLESTQNFFLEQRLVWAMIIVAISMTITSGQSVFGLFARTGGTALAMIFTIVIWYIVDQHAPGVIVFLWLFVFIEYYLFIKVPRFIPVWLVLIITQCLIIGYELQVEVIGIAAASALGQPYYPIYELAPYRLACVAGGSVVAFIWTIFPYPLTDSSWLRKDLGATIYLLANYYSIVHSTVRARISQTEGDMEDKNSPGRKLEKARHKVFGKLLLLLPSLNQHADWQKWEPSLGGKFPADTYNSIILRLTNIMHYLSLISYSSQTWTADSSPLADSPRAVHSAWLQDLAILMEEVGPTAHSFTSTLSLLSASVSQGTALPPYLQLPQPYGLSRKLEKLDKGILSSKHVEEPGYSAYAVMQVATSLITDDLKRLADDVKSLVGEVDFSFTVMKSEDSSETDIKPTNNGKGKQE